MLLQALCIVSKPSVNSNSSYSPETLNLIQNWRFLSRVILKFDGCPWKTKGHCFYATSRYWTVCHCPAQITHHLPFNYTVLRGWLKYQHSRWLIDQQHHSTYSFCNFGIYHPYLIRMFHVKTEFLIEIHYRNHTFSLEAQEAGYYHA